MIAPYLINFVRSCLVALIACSSTHAATYYVDPATGSMTNPGTSSRPWNTLEAVFAANKTFASGDVILLRSGYHGAPVVKGNNSGNVTIQPDSGATPKIKNLIVRSASRWVIAGLDICPEHAGSGVTYDGTVAEIESSSNFITLRDSSVRCALNANGWTVSDWQSRTDRGLRTAAPNSTISNNFIGISGFALTTRKTANNSLISRNVVKGFCMDGIVALADDCVIEYNMVSDSYVADSNHDDLFQSWSTGPDNAVGEGTIYRVTLRGNTFISRTDPNQPHSTQPQGIGCFDGKYEGWVVENNLIVTNHPHGISLYGAINCRIVNNTAVQNLLNASSSKPWIQIFPLKDNTPATGNLVRNNISASAAEIPDGAGTIDHNLTTTAYTTYFTNPAGFDYSLKSTSPAVGAGESANAPTIDILGRPRSLPYDVGAYEYSVSAYQQWLQANGLPVDGSGNGAPGADPLKDGVSNALKFALGLPASTRGYGGRFITGKTTVANKNYLSVTYTRPDPAPSGTGYAVKVSPNLSAWTAFETVEVSSTLSNGLRTITVRDTVPMETGQRFIRLEITLP